MSADDYQIHNIYRYTRKSYKQSRSCPRDCVLDSSREDVDQAENPEENVAFELRDHSLRSDDYGVVTGCLYELEPEGDVTNILHKKCPVITLAQQQLLRVLDETNHILARIPEERCSALIRCLCRCKESSLCPNKACCCFMALIFVAFFTGLLLGAATCGTHLGKFDNPILNCMDNYFIPDSYTSIEDTFHCIT